MRLISSILLSLGLLSCAPMPSAPPQAFTPRLVNGWAISCRWDAMHDVRTCLAQKGSILILQERPQEPNLAIVGAGDMYPGTLVYVRIDAQPAIPLKAQLVMGEDAHAIVAALQHGTVARTRYQSWPRKQTQEAVVDLAGLQEALAVLDRRLQTNNIEEYAYV